MKTWEIYISGEVIWWGRDDVVDYLAQYGQVLELPFIVLLIGNKSMLSVLLPHDGERAFFYTYDLEAVRDNDHADLSSAVTRFLAMEGK